jgi:hypothetical protein
VGALAPEFATIKSILPPPLRSAAAAEYGSCQWPVLSPKDISHYVMQAVDPSLSEPFRLNLR